MRRKSTKSSTLVVNGKACVTVPVDVYEHLTQFVADARMPALPKADRDGNYPAIAYCRASTAREVITARVERGLTRAELARLARVRVATLERLESGKHEVDVRTVDKIDAALKHTVRTRATSHRRA